MINNRNWLDSLGAWPITLIFLYRRSQVDLTFNLGWGPSLAPYTQFHWVKLANSYSTMLMCITYDRGRISCTSRESIKVS